MIQSAIADALLALIGQQGDVKTQLTYLTEQADAFRQDRQKTRFYQVFTAIPRSVAKTGVAVSEETSRELSRLRPGFSVAGWTRDRVARVWWLLQLPADDPTSYVKTITQLFKAGELNELVALYSALPVLAYPEAWRFQATEGIRNNIASVQSAIMLNNPYPADYFDEAAWNQMILKAVFTEKHITHIIGWDPRKTARRARRLADYAAERRAAGRSLPPNMERLL